MFFSDNITANSKFLLSIATDDFGTVYVDGKAVLTTKVAFKVFNFSVDSTSRILAVQVVNDNKPLHYWLGFSYVGFALESLNSDIITDPSWKCVASSPSTPNWIQYNYDDSSWSKAVCYDTTGDWRSKYKGLPQNSFSSPYICWIGFSTHLFIQNPAYCRKILR